MPRSRRTSLSILLTAAVLLLLFALGSSVVSLSVHHLWFHEVGYPEVFWYVFWARWWVGVSGGLVVAAFLFANLNAVRRGLVGQPYGIIPPAFERYLRSPRLRPAVLLVSLGFGVMAGFGFADQWHIVELFRHRVPWGTVDPIFGRDIAFYVFELPVYRLLVQLLTGLTSLSLLLAAGVYFASGALQPLERGVYIHPWVRMHLGILIALLLLVKSASYWLSTYELLQSPGTMVFGASYTDLHAKLPALRILTVIAAGAALTAVWAAWQRRLRPLAMAVGGLVLASFLLGSVWPALMQRFIVQPNEQVLERPYIEHHLRMTRQAYGLDNVTVRDFPATPTLNWEVLRQNRDTLDNIRLWDVRPLLSTYRQRQNIRQYYDFHDIDVDRYTLDGRYFQTLLSARELDHAQLRPDAQTWVNLHLRYTHGYGVVMSPAARVGAGGQPDFLIRDIPPQSTVNLRITRPEIYFGEVIAAYAIVNTRVPEIDYPLGDESVAQSYYAGRAGIPVGSLLRRILFALYLGDANLLFSSAITAESRILIHRQILPRVEAIAPFLRYDRDPYLVIGDDGRLYWMIDAYTVARGYPYSAPYTGDYAPRHFRGYNYVRNSVKVVVDAYDGDVRFYLFDPQDPVIRAYARLFPSLLRPASEMPADLRRHARYPEDLFRLQAEMYTLYHMRDPDVFYNKEDVWALPQELFEQEPVIMEPYYLIMRLSTERQPEFLLMLPFTPADRENMIAWMAGRSDGEHLGELFVFQLPKDRQIFGPLQVENRINQNAEIAQSLALWNQQGTQVIRGNLLVIPIADSLLYVEPLYLRSADGGLPELRRVIVTYGDEQPVMGRNLDEALAQLLGDPEPSGTRQAPPDAGPTTPAEPDSDEGLRWRELTGQARRLYTEAMEALRRGDFATFGERIRALGEVLRLLDVEGTRPSTDPIPKGT